MSEFVLPTFISIGIAAAGFLFSILMTRNRNEGDELDRAERKLAETERLLRECRQDCDRLRNENWWLQRRALGLRDQEEGKN